MRTDFRFRHGKRLITVVMALVLTADGGTVAGSDAEVDGLDAVTELREPVQLRIDKAIAAIDDGCTGIAVTDCLRDVLPIHLPRVVAAYDGYADDLAALSVPAEHSADVEVHVEALGSAAALLTDMLEAARAGHADAIPGFADRLVSLHVELAQELDPAYGRAAFVSPFVGLPNTPFQRMDLVALMGSSAEEQAYLDAVREVSEIAFDRERCVVSVLRDAADSIAEVLGRLSECGVGDSFATMLEQASALVPPARFDDEHAWWLATLERLVAIDRSSSDAIGSEDLAHVVADIVRAGLATLPFTGLDPAFGAAVQPPGSRLGSAPDPVDPVARSPYGRELFGALVAYWVADPRFHGTFPLELGGLPDDVVLEAIVDAAPDLRTVEVELRGRVDALEPPPAFEADHAVIEGYLERERDRLEAFIAAAEAGDVAAVRAAWDAGFADYCATSQSLSDDIRPVADVVFAGLACR